MEGLVFLLALVPIALLVLLITNSRSIVPGPSTIVDTLRIAIENGNDRPLDVTGIHAFQLEQRMIAKLAAGMPYMITTADSKANTPRYDMAHFRDSLPPSFGVLNIPAMIARPGTREAGPSIAPSMNWECVAIIGIGAITAEVITKHELDA